MVAPGRAPTADEAAAYRAFVRSGGTLVLADDFGAGNALLAAVGSGMRLDQRNLSSLERAFELPGRRSGFPSGATPRREHHIRRLRPPRGRHGRRPFLVTSRLSWMDENGERPARPERVPRAGSRSPRARTSALGKVVAVGDASLFINAMQDLRIGDNAPPARAPRPRRRPRRPGLSRTASANGPVGTVLWLQERPVLIVAATAIALAALAWRAGRQRRRVV